MSFENPVFDKYRKFLNTLNSELLHLRAKRTHVPDETLETEISLLEQEIQKLETGFNPTDRL